MPNRLTKGQGLLGKLIASVATITTLTVTTLNAMSKLLALSANGARSPCCKVAVRGIAASC